MFYFVALHNLIRLFQYFLIVVALSNSQMESGGATQSC